MLVRLLRRHLRPYTGLLLCVLVLQFAQVMASLYLPPLNADIIDKGVATGDTGYIWRMGAFMLVVSVGQGVCSVAATLAVIEGCGCASGCPSCVQSPKCGNNNEPLDKAGAAALLRLLLEAAPATGPHAP